MTHRFGDFQKMLAVIEQQIMALEQQNDPQYADALANLRAKQQELVRRLSNSGVAGKESSAMGSQSVYVGGNANNSPITVGSRHRVQTTTFDQRGQKVHSQTNIAGDAKGPILSGNFYAPVSTGDNVQTGGIRVGKVSARHAVVGTKIENATPDSLAALSPLIRETQQGGIDVKEVNSTEETVIGLQYVADPASTTGETLHQMVTTLRQKLLAAKREGLLASSQEADDAEEAQAALLTVEQQLARAKPRAKTVLRNLKNVTEILTDSGHSATYLPQLAPLAESAMQIAKTLLED